MAVAAVRENVERVLSNVAEAAQRAGRGESAVTLVAVSKTHDLPMIAAASQAGLRHFGENRVEEARDKIEAARSGELPADVVWHMVGHIQSRKTDDVAPLFDWVHSIDRWKIARRLEEHLAGSPRSLDVLLEVNVSGEESKYGYDLSVWPEGGSRAEAQFAALAADVEQMTDLERLRLRGLMTLAPYTEDPETVRPVFRRLRHLRDALRDRFPGLSWDELSMGMSADYEVAVEEGATLVRVGTAIFGVRQYS